LQAPGLHTFGVNVDEFADAVYGRLSAGEDEIGYGLAETGRVAFRNAFGDSFVAMSDHFMK
ncbi:hypothetical protein AeNC1_004787, partial [Aphanomyces euteiches]